MNIKCERDVIKCESGLRILLEIFSYREQLDLKTIFVLVHFYIKQS